MRIITYTLTDLEKVDNFIANTFDVIEKRDVGEERYKEGKFGYQSIHYLIKFPDNRISLPDNVKYSGLICEIQIRTVLQHAWAEIEHDIQYKNRSDVPRTLQRRFIALAGLLEIADREFQTIQNEDQNLKRTISESLQEDITRATIATASRKNEEPVRNLIQAGRYKEAIEIYNEKIIESPNMYTLYLGRSKAKFLFGDRSGALQDIDVAIGFNSDDEVAKKLREQITEGAIEEPKTISSEANELTKKGNQFLERGDGVSAFEFYSKAQEGGASRPFSLINKAMACFLASDFDGAIYLLGLLNRRLGTPMSINVTAMMCLVYAITNTETYDLEFSKLEEALESSENFIFSMSPLIKLRRSREYWKVHIDESAEKRIENVFNKIEN